MTVASDLRTFLIENVSLQSLIGDRVHAAMLPQRPILPAITFQWITGERGYTYDGPNGLSTPRVQIDVWAATYLEMEAVANAVRLLMDGFKGDMGLTTIIQGVFFASERDLYESGADLGTGSGTAVYRRSMDFFLNYEEETV